MDMENARLKMVDQQVRAFDVFEPSILDLLRELPRDEFVPVGFEKLAYADTQIPLAHDQFMMTPAVEGRLLQSLRLTPDDEVLEIGTGSGFLTACLGSLARSVQSVDLYPDFIDDASSRLADAGVENTKAYRLDVTRELPDGQFDAIAVTASVPVFDDRYLDLLKPDGRLFVIVGKAPVMEAMLVARDDDMKWQAESLFETSLLPVITPDEVVKFRF